MQKLAGIITESVIMHEEGDGEVNNAVNQIKSELQDFLGDIEAAASKAKPSPKDGEINELVLTLTALVVGMPGLINLLGKGVDAIERFIDPMDPSQAGAALQKVGHDLEHSYIDSISGWIQTVFPKKYKDQDPFDENSDLHDVAHGIYASMLTGAAVASGIEAANAVNIIAKGLEGGASAFKTSEVITLAKKIAGA
jgi:hypothetical protein